MSRLLVLAATIAIAAVAVPVATGHRVPATKTEINGGLLGQQHHLRRVLPHVRGAFVVCRRARMLSASSDCRWHHDRYVKTKKRLRWLAANIDPWAKLRSKIPADAWANFVYKIHPCEGHWNSYPGGPGVLNSGGPYYGGLQMDLGFQQTYGSWALARWGTANNWPVVVQVYVAYRAMGPGGRGYYPWPACADRAGLI